MTCDRTRLAMATGGPLRRWLVRRHLARCPACSAAADDLRRLRDALAATPPLTSEQRRAWLDAAIDEAAATRTPAKQARTPRLALAASILGLIGLGAWLAIRPRSPATAPVGVEVAPAVVKAATLRDLDTLRAGTSALSKELEALRREVELLDARRDVDALQLRFATIERPAFAQP